MNDEATKLHGERILLRAWRLTDADALYELASDTAVAECAGFPAHKSIEDSRRVIQEVFAAPECYAIVARENGNPIGCIQTFIPHEDAASQTVYEASTVEVGFWLGRQYWGKGLMLESLKLLYNTQYHSGKFKWGRMIGRTKKDNSSAGRTFVWSGFREERDLVYKEDDTRLYERHDIDVDVNLIDDVREIGWNYFRIEDGVEEYGEEPVEEWRPLKCRLISGAQESLAISCGTEDDYPEAYIPFMKNQVGDIVPGYLLLIVQACRRITPSEASAPCSLGTDVSVLRIHKIDEHVYGTLDGFPHCITIVHPSTPVSFETISALHTLKDGELVECSGKFLLHIFRRYKSPDSTTMCSWAAHEGHAAAQFHLGELYEHGVHYLLRAGIDSDLKMASKWYQKAALQGYEDATKALERIRESEDLADNAEIAVVNEKPLSRWQVVLFGTIGVLLVKLLKSCVSG